VVRFKWFENLAECIYDHPYGLIPLLSLNIHSVMCLYILLVHGCNSSTIQPTMQSPRTNQTPSVNVWLVAMCLRLYLHTFNSSSPLIVVDCYIFYIVIWLCNYYCCCCYFYKYWADSIIADGPEAPYYIDK